MQMPGSGGERVWVCAGAGAGGCSCPEVLGGWEWPFSHLPAWDWGVQRFG